MAEGESLPTNTEIPVSDLNVNKDVSDKPSSGFKLKKIVITVIVLVIIAVIGTSLVFLLSKKNNSSSDLTQAKIFMNAGEYGKAQDLFAKELNKNVNNPDALSGMINAISLEGNQTGNEDAQFKKSEPYITEALKSFPDNNQVLLSSGYAYETAGKYDEALKYYEQALKNDPKSADALFRHAHVLEFLGKRQDAYKEYDRAYALDPNNTYILMARGNMFLSQGKIQESFDSFKKASEQPNINSQTKAEALTGAAIIRSNQDNFAHIKEATDLSKQAVDADPNFSPALAAYGYNLYLTAQDKSSALPFVQKAIAANPRISRNYFLLATMQRAIKDYANAINSIKEARLRVDSDNTLVSESDRTAAKANYTYELAKTYDIASLNVDTLSLIKEAVTLNPSLKSNVRDDVIMYNLFKDLQKNQEFINLVKAS